MSTVALNNLWIYIQSLALTNSNKDWLASKLMESKVQNVEEKRILKPFPKTFSPGVIKLAGILKDYSIKDDYKEEIMDYLTEKYK